MPPSIARRLSRPAFGAIRFEVFPARAISLSQLLFFVIGECWGGIRGCQGREHRFALPRRDIARILRFRWPFLGKGLRQSRAPTAPALPCAMGSKARTRL